MNRGHSRDDRQDGEAACSRRDFIMQSARGVVPLIGSLMPLGHNWGNKERPGRQWYEIVQDMKTPSLWHLNLFKAQDIGDLQSGRLLEHRLLEARDLDLMLDSIGHPLRIQFRNGKASSIGM